MKKLAFALALLLLAGTVAACTTGANSAVYQHPPAGWGGWR